MKIKIEPTNVMVPNKGIVAATQIEVDVASYKLNEGAALRYALQTVENGPPAKAGGPATVKTTPVGSGQKALTAEEFAAWSADDAAMVRGFVTGLGLKPAN